jgi:cytidylate kinase
MMMKGKDRSSPLRTRKAKEQWIKRRNLMYKKLETRLKHDQARNHHLFEIDQLENQALELTMDTDEWRKVMAKHELYKTQLEIYDKIIYGIS